jgi:hypothetical protein
LKLELAYWLTEGKVDPRAIKELTQLAVLMKEEQIPLFESPEAVLIMTHRSSQLLPETERVKKDFNQVHIVNDCC